MKNIIAIAYNLNIFTVVIRHLHTNIQYVLGQIACIYCSLYQKSFNIKYSKKKNYAKRMEKTQIK